MELYSQSMRTGHMQVLQAEGRPMHPASALCLLSRWLCNHCNSICTTALVVTVGTGYVHQEQGCCTSNPLPYKLLAHIVDNNQQCAPLHALHCACTTAILETTGQNTTHVEVHFQHVYANCDVRHWHQLPIATGRSRWHLAHLLIC